MTDPTRRTIDNGSLVDLLDRLVETGVVATGDVLLGLADVDLIRVNLQLVLGAVDKLQAGNGQQPASQVAQTAAGPRTDRAGHAQPVPGRAGQPVSGSQPDAHDQPRLPLQRTAPPPPRLDAADRSDLGVGGLLVAVVEIVHRLLERQAIHRMERGTLTSDQIERLGQALMALDQRINQLIEIFNPHSAPALPVAITGATH
jgi:Gas vesicle protein K/Gas vesicle protein